MRSVFAVIVFLVDLAKLEAAAEKYLKWITSLLSPPLEAP